MKNTIYRNGSESLIEKSGYSMMKSEFSNYVEGIHYNNVVEQAILGIAMIEASKTGLICGLIETKHFYMTDNQVVAEAILNINKRNEVVDMVSVMIELMSGGVMRFGDRNTASHLSHLTDNVTTSATIMQYIANLVKMWKLRKVMEIVSLQKKVGENPEELLSEIEARIDEIRKSSGASFTDTMAGVMNNGQKKELAVGNKILGITTGFLQMDNGTGGFENGCLYILAARPSVGKTAFMARCALEAARDGKNVGIIQLEMGVEQMHARMQALYADIPFGRVVAAFRDDTDRVDYYRAMDGYTKLPIFINNQDSVNLEGIKSWAYSMKHEGKLDILFIDYLQLVESSGRQSREQDVSAISRGLKLLARALKIPIIALSQLNRAIETRSIKRPILSDLRESGAIEQDADAVYFVHRDYAMGIEEDAAGNSTENEAELIFAKNRNGARGSFPLKYDGPKMKFYEPNWLDNRT